MPGDILILNISTSALIRRCVFFGLYPILSFFFSILDLGRFWGSWSVIGVSVLFFSIGMSMWKLTDEPDLPSFSSTSAHYILFFYAWFGFIFYELILSGEWLYASLVILLDVAITYFVVFGFLDKRHLLKRLDTPFNKKLWEFLWFIFILSSAVPTTLGLTRLHSILSLLPIITYSIVFGWFGLETAPRIVPKTLGAHILAPAYFIFIVLLYGGIETANPALKYFTPDSGQVILLSLISVYVMFISRSMYKSFSQPLSDKRQDVKQAISEGKVVAEA